MCEHYCGLCRDWVRGGESEFIFDHCTTTTAVLDSVASCVFNYIFTFWTLCVIPAPLVRNIDNHNIRNQ